MDHPQNRQRSRSSAMYATRTSSQQLPQARIGGRSSAPSYDSSWVRSSLSQLHFLHSMRSVDAEPGPAIDFAIRWGWLERTLLDALAAAWRLDNAAPVGSVR